MIHICIKNKPIISSETLNWVNMESLNEINDNLDNFFPEYDRRSLSKIENLPSSLSELHCEFSRISKIENLPISLTYLNCYGSDISKIENLPRSLIFLSFNSDKVKYVDDIPIDQLNFQRWNFIERYNIIKKLQRRMKIRYKIKNEKAKIIQAGCENWLYKPYCNDNTIGIVPRLSMKELNLK